MRAFLLFLLLLLEIVPRPAYAAELEQSAAGLFETQRMEQGMSAREREISGAVPTADYDAQNAMRRLWRAFAERLRQEAKGSAGCAASLLALVFGAGFASALSRDGKHRGVIDVCGACAAAVLLLGNVDSLVSETTEALFHLSDYSKAALPVVFTAAAAGGAVSSAGARYASASLALDVMMSLSQKAVIPLIYAYLSLSITDALFPNPLIAAVGRLTKWMARITMTGSALAFSVCIGITSLITTAVDASAVKTARMVISGALPVVGGMVSDASAAVLAAANVVRSCTGAFGLVAVCAMCVGPFAVLSVRTIVFKAAAAAADSVQSARLHSLLGCVGDTVAMLMGLLGTCAVMLFLSFGSAMKAVGGL